METQAADTKTLKEKLHRYVDNASEDELNDMLSFVEEEEIEILSPEIEELLENEEFWKEQDRIYEEIESGKVKGIPAEEVHKEIREMLRNNKSR